MFKRSPVWKAASGKRALVIPTYYQPPVLAKSGITLAEFEAQIEDLEEAYGKIPAIRKGLFVVTFSFDAVICSGGAEVQRIQIANNTVSFEMEIYDSRIYVAIRNGEIGKIIMATQDRIAPLPQQKCPWEEKPYDISEYVIWTGEGEFEKAVRERLRLAEEALRGDIYEILFEQKVPPVLMRKIGDTMVMEHPEWITEYVVPERREIARERVGEEIRKYMK